MSISNPEIKKLYGLAAGRCSICRKSVFKEDIHIGEMAHIIARNPNGARGNEELFGNKNSYDNLILLCPNHHTEVDNKPSTYTVDVLHSIKAEHEKNVASHFDAPDDRKNDLTFLKGFMEYVPFTKIPYFIEPLPIAVKLQLCDVGDVFEALRKDNPHLYPLNDQSLQNYFSSFIKSYYDLWDIISGYTLVEGRSQANFGQADEQFNLFMEKKYLPYEEILKLSSAIDEKKIKFETAYNQLIEFLRKNYKEVDLNSYKQPEI
ncbi:HNH endonuclease [Pseudoalteromonas piscicida]|uniref:HNH endonuclease signature motif containing protein n=1 Tax=Pseudoalteromonas piscicida TaxID=43662 RepID=UPI001D09B78A|nr:HNH endonuclease signature motif containing protein [Pseudoalteromonas piscicida]UDM62943.1 HNH endonuclease [Pseudoalteromonas piscicida]